MAWNGLEVASSAPTQDEADVRVSNEPTRSIQDERETGFPHLNRRNHVPNKLEVDLCDDSSDRGSVANNCNCQVWLGASVVGHVAEPGPGRAGANHGWVGGPVRATVNSIEPDTRDIKTLQAPMIEKCESNDRGRLPKQA